MAVASAEPQFFYNTPVVQSPLAYTPYTYIAKPIEMKKAEEKKPEEEMKEIKPVVYASPLAYNYANTFPYTTSAPPAVYTHPTVYADPAPVYYSKIEAIPKYHAKNGEVEHKVYKRSADADPALLYANAFTGYSTAAAAPFYPYAASTYAYSAAFPYNYGFNYAASPYYQWY